MAGQSLLLKSYNFVNGWVLSTSRINISAIQTRTIKMSTKEKLKELKIPDKPKKPLSPYLQFINEKRLELAKNNPDLKITEIVKKLSVEWKSVSDEQIEKYKQHFIKSKEKYDKEILEYNSKLTEEQRQTLQQASNEKRQDKKKRIVTKFIKESDKPKRPQGPYLLYLKEQSLTRNIPHNELMKALKGDWAVLSTSEKKKYKDEYLKEKEKYEEQLQKWEKTMIAEGHKDFVRAKTLQEVEPRPSRVIDLKKKNPSQH